jgi:methyl-accepting chemotaxis protein
MFNLNLRNKLLLLALLPLVTILILILSISYYSELNALEENITDFRASLIKERKSELKEVTEIAAGIISYQASLGDKGNINAALQDIRFGKAGYFFIYNTKGVTIFHGVKPELVGKNLIELKDSKGNKILLGLLDAAQNGDGNYSYYYQKPGSEEQVEKLGYAIMLPGTDWMLGTGAYIDDIDIVINEYALRASKASTDQLFLLLAISIGLIILTIIIILITATKMAKPIERMASNLNDIAQGEGDLTKRLEITGKDEIAQLGESFNLFVDKLQQMIQEISSATTGVNQAGSEMSNQSSAITAQLISHNQETEQVVSAITEMSLTANEVASNTNQVADATHAVTQDVIHAQECVNASVSEISGLVEEINSAASNMGELSEQSKKINNVLSVIGGIAEQTNLLALNAAIEAARAGEQGRGFAVVADEVRSLASRTQDSTLEINEMLTELHNLVARLVTSMELSQERSIRSADSTNAISESLTSVTTAVDSINDMSTQIATAATEQSSVTEEINRNIYTIQEIVNTLTQGSEIAENTSQTVSSAGNKLEQLVSTFKI